MECSVLRLTRAAREALERKRKQNKNCIKIAEEKKNIFSFHFPPGLLCFCAISFVFLRGLDIETYPDKLACEYLSAFMCVGGGGEARRRLCCFELKEVFIVASSFFFRCCTRFTLAKFDRAKSWEICEFRFCSLHFDVHLVFGIVLHVSKLDWLRIARVR